MADLGVTGGETRDDPPPADAVGTVVRVAGPVAVVPSPAAVSGRTRSTVTANGASQQALPATARTRFILINPATSQQVVYFNMDGAGSATVGADQAIFPGGIYIDETGWQGAVDVIWPNVAGALDLVVDEDVP